MSKKKPFVFSDGRVFNSRETAPRMFVPAVGVSSKHPVVIGSTFDKCDLCEGNQKPMRLWPASDLDLEDKEVQTTLNLHPRADDTFALCQACDIGENIAAEDRDLGVKPARKKHGLVTGVQQFFGYGDEYYGGAAKPYIAKCIKPHYEEIAGPEGFGYLRAVSLRGGWAIDDQCDYALFFDQGWKVIAEPDTTRFDPAGKGLIPPFGEKEEDRSKWPSVAFVKWQDMSAPTPEAVRAATWAAKQWKAGKNIQFGCFGAHGRSGTFLAMLLLKTKQAVDAKDAEEQVHEKLCKDAIENKSQHDFIKAYAAELAK